jgi:2-desacetyl-2-hydroxyethyl bacteriochlorophyllide A dehydrogenase
VRAFVIDGPGRGAVRDVEPPRAEPGLAIVEVERVGLCGTDEELFSGEMSYFETGDAWYPMRPGHEWCGRVVEIGEGVDTAWLGRRVTGDTMLGDGTCERCRSGRQHLCENRYEIGIRRGWPGALAERLPVPASALLALPDEVDPTLGALVEPGGNAVRALRAADVRPNERMLVFGPGAIGCLVALLAVAVGIEVHLVGRSEGSIAFARSLGFERVWTDETIPEVRFDGVVDATNAAKVPARALELAEPGRHVSLIGIASEPSLVDTRSAVLREVTISGVLSASGGLAEAIDRYASGSIDPRPLVAATVGLDDVASVLAGGRDAAWGSAPKIHVDPHR